MTERFEVTCVVWCNGCKTFANNLMREAACANMKCTVHPKLNIETSFHFFKTLQCPVFTLLSHILCTLVSDNIRFLQNSKFVIKQSFQSTKVCRYSLHLLFKQMTIDAYMTQGCWQMSTDLNFKNYACSAYHNTCTYI